MGIEHSLTDQQGDCMDLTITICDMVRDVYVYILYILYIYIYIYILYICVRVCVCAVYMHVFWVNQLDG